MNSINWKRVILGGLLAGLVINASEFVQNVVVLKDDWAKAMQALNKPAAFGGGQIAAFNVVGFLIGIAALWLYAAIRPRFGEGMKTALLAGFVLWCVGSLIPNIGFMAMDLFPFKPMAVSTVWSLVEVLIATALGARFYKEEPAQLGARSASAR